MKKMILQILCLAIVTSIATTVLAAQHQPAAKTTFFCFGNEPFWSIHIKPTEIIYELAGSPKTKLQFVKPSKALGMKPDFVKVYRTHTLQKKVPVTVVMTWNEKGCSDGMSDQDHQYDVVVLFPKDVLSGCCNRKNS